MELSLNRADGSTLCSRCVVADSPKQRARGLLGRTKLEPGEGIYLATSSIHTHFMRFPIDVIFLDAEMTVLRIRHSLKPWRFAFRRGAEGVVELEAGVCERVGLDVGERLSLVGKESGGVAARNGSSIRVAVGTHDRRFHRVSSFLLSRNGFIVAGGHEPDDVAELVGSGSVDVVLLDASESLVSAARTARTLEALAPEIGLVLAVNGEEGVDRSAGELPTVPKWGSFDVIVEALERTFAVTRLDDLS
jgi:uncharacterized protein